MNHYRLGLIGIAMLITPIVYLPRFFIEARFTGAIPAIIIAAMTGSLISIWFLHSMKQSRGLTVLEVIKKQVPSYLGWPLHVCMSITGYVGGALVLITMSSVTMRFINPTMDIHVLLLCFLLAGGWSALRSSRALMFGMEYWILLCVPLLFFLWFKSVSNTMFDWDAVLMLTDYVKITPSWQLIFVGSFIFTGFISFYVFKEAAKWQASIHEAWMIPLAGVIVFCGFFFIPFGVHGTQAVEHYNYIWMNTADSIQLKHGMIERGVFIYLAVYMIISLLFISISWYSAAAWLMNGVLASAAYSPKKTRRIQQLVVVVMAVVAFAGGHYMNEQQLFLFTKYWFFARFIVDVILVWIVGSAVKRSKLSL